MDVGPPNLALGRLPALPPADHAPSPPISKTISDSRKQLKAMVEAAGLPGVPAAKPQPKRGEARSRRARP